MEKKTIDLVTSLKEIKEIENNLASLKIKHEKLQEEIHAAASDIFSPLREKIITGLLENMDKETLYRIKEQEEKELRRKAHGMVVFESNRIFNPRHDSFQIQSIRFNEDKTKVKLNVECIKNRQYLGITGAWIPDTYETTWFSPKELIADVRINEKSNLIS